MVPSQEDEIAIVPIAFGNVIRALRDRKGLTQEAFGTLVNLHRTHIGMIERGERNLKLTTVYQIAAKLNIPIPELMELLVNEIKKQDLK